MIYKHIKTKIVVLFFKMFKILYRKILYCKASNEVLTSIKNFKNSNSKNGAQNWSKFTKNYFCLIVFPIKVMFEGSSNFKPFTKLWLFA